MWNFKGNLWNSTQNILPIQWKIYFLYNIEILRALRFKSSYAFLKRPRHKICQGKWATGCILWVMLRTLAVLLQEITACSPCILYLALGRLCRLIPVYCQGKNNGCWNSLADNKRFSRLINIHRPAILYLKVVLKNGVNPGIKNLNTMSECLPHVNLTRSLHVTIETASHQWSILLRKFILALISFHWIKQTRVNFLSEMDHILLFLD